MATIRPLTDEERIRLLKIIIGPSSDEPIPTDTGPGISLFEDSGRWLCGILFISNESNVLAGGCIPEAQGAGIWIQYWPQMLEWAHSIHNEFIVEQDNDKQGDLMMKLGGINKEYFELNGMQWNKVTFRKQ